MYDVSGEAAVCCRHTFHQLLQQTDTPEGYIFGVSVTHPYLTRYTNHCHRYLIQLCATQNISPYISVLPTSEVGLSHIE